MVEKGPCKASALTYASYRGYYSYFYVKGLF